MAVVDSRALCAAIASILVIGCTTAGPSEDGATFAAPPPGGVLVIGEMHGSNEAPAAFRAIVDKLRENGPVAVGIEASPDADQARCAGDARPFGEFWTRDYQDGRSSLAMQDLVCALRAQRDDNLRLVYLDRDHRDYPESFDSYAARRLDAAMGDGWRGVVLTGNFHARNAENSLTGELRALGRETVSATVSVSQGEAWICGNDGSCGVQEFALPFCPADAETDTLGLSAEIEDTRWDRCLILPAMTASRPAKESVD